MNGFVGSGQVDRRNLYWSWCFFLQSKSSRHHYTYCRFFDVNDQLLVDLYENMKTDI
jgi:hypothetical protein